MKKILTILTLTLFGAIVGFGQTSNQTNTSSGSSDEYNRTEFFVGYSLSRAKVNQYDRDFRLITNPALGNTFKKSEYFKKGFAAAGAVNFSRYIGAKIGVSWNFNNRKGRLNNQDFEVKERLATYTLGLQIKDNKKDAGNRLRPFANLSAGVANTRSTLKNCIAFGATCPNSLNKNRSGFVGIVGGGLDLKLNDRVSFRVIQADYMFGKIAKGWRFSSGIVF